MAVFITGVAGFLGSHLADHFIGGGDAVSGIDDLSGGSVVNVPEEVNFRVADCRDRMSYQDLIRPGDVVFHCAAAAHDGLSVFSPAYVSERCAQATVEVATASANADVRRLVFCSSMARYGDQQTPFTEDLPPCPVTPYGCAKVYGEQVLRILATAHGFEYCVAVPHNIYGPRQRRDDPYRNVVAIMMNRMLQGLQPVIYGDGSQLRCFSFISDVVRPLALIGGPAVGSGEVINVGPDEEDMTVLALAELVAETVGFDLDPIFFPSRPNEVHSAICSAGKARSLLGYRTEVDLREGIQIMADWMVSVGPLPFDYRVPIEISTPTTPATWAMRLL